MGIFLLFLILIVHLPTVVVVVGEIIRFRPSNHRLHGLRCVLIVERKVGLDLVEADLVLVETVDAENLELLVFLLVVVQQHQDALLLPTPVAVVVVVELAFAIQ
jgi:hypothetical protein